MADIALFARDLLATDFTLLEGDLTVAQALARLAQTKVTFGILISATGVPMALTTAGALAAIPDDTTRLQSITTLPGFAVEADAALDQIASLSARTLVENPELAGLVVEDKGQVVGVLTRQSIRKFAKRGSTRGGDIAQLAGIPLTRVKYFVCPNGDFKKLIVFYDPDDPPMCPTHQIALSEQD